MKQLALIGSGGFAAELEDIAEQVGWRIAGFYSLTPGRFKDFHRGYLDELCRDRQEFDGVSLGIGAVNRETLAVRQAKIEWLDEHKFDCPPLVSPSAIIGKGAVVARGAVVGPGAILGLDSRVGAFSIINAGAIIGHDVKIGRNVTVAPGAFLAGGCKVGDVSLIGPLAKVLQNVSIGASAMIGMGANVFRDIPDGADVWPRPDRAVSPV
jgi:sugar O-acyltransferase (sialic acid O-acetyltransferase NeuD family)